MEELLKIFFAGIAMGNGPCLFFCMPIIIPLIMALPEQGDSSVGWKTGLKFAVIFSVSRLFAYSLLGFMSVVLYRFVFGVIGTRGVYLKLVLGVLIILLGALYLLNIGRGFVMSSPLCGILRAKMEKRSRYSLVLFGLLVGFSPCAPLLAVLTYIAATAKDPMWGLFGGFFFGLGTVITPLIPLGTLAGFMVDRLKRSPRSLMVVRGISAAILIYFGIRLIFPL